MKYGYARTSTDDQTPQPWEQPCVVFMRGPKGHRMFIKKAEPSQGVASCECGKWTIGYPRAHDRVTTETARSVVESHKRHVGESE